MFVIKPITIRCEFWLKLLSGTRKLDYSKVFRGEMHVMKGVQTYSKRKLQIVTFNTVVEFGTNVKADLDHSSEVLAVKHTDLMSKGS